MNQLTTKLMEFLSGYHERCQVGSVYGKEDDSEHSPDIGHESGGESSRRIYVYSRLK